MHRLFSPEAAKTFDSSIRFVIAAHQFWPRVYEIASEMEDELSYITPPEMSADDFPESDISNKSLRPGRLTIKCIRANDIQRKGQRYAIEKTQFNPSLHFTLGSTSFKPREATSRTHQDTDANPSFKDELIIFDVQHPKEIISSNGKKIKMKIELLSKNLLQFDVLGEVEILANRFFRPFASTTEEFPIQLAGERIIHASITLGFEFIPFKEGILSLSLCNFDKFISSLLQDNKLELRCGNETKVSMGNEIVHIMMNKSNWSEDLNLILRSKGEDPPENIGKYTLSLLPLIQHHFDEDINETSIGIESRITFLSTKSEEELSIGNATTKLQFMQAGYLTMKDICGQAFEKSTLLPNSGLQLVLKSKGVASTVVEKSCILRYEFPGKDVVWDDQLVLPLVDHYLLSIDLYQLDALGSSQDLVGSGEVSLLPIFKNGTDSTSVDLERPNEVGVRMKRGTLKFTLDFEGNGLSYPKLHHTSMVRHAREKSPQSKLLSPKKLSEKAKVALHPHRKFFLMKKSKAPSNF